MTCLIPPPRPHRYHCIFTLLTFLLAEPPCKEGLDIAVVLDVSNSVPIPFMEKAIIFLKRLVNDNDPRSNGTHFGLITFNRRPKLEFNFIDTRYYKRNAVLKKLDDLRSAHSLKETKEKNDSKYSSPHLALRMATDQLFTVPGGDRSDKPNVLIALTDGVVFPPPHTPDAKHRLARYMDVVAASLMVSGPNVIEMAFTQGGGGGTQKSFMRGGSALRSTPLPFYIPFLTEKVPLSYTFH